MSTKAIDSLLPELTGLDDALEILLKLATPVTEHETLTLNDALGRTLASDIVSDINVPQMDCSAMDGYAVRRSDINNSDETRLPISQRITAGEVGTPLIAGTAARIFTGALLPLGANCVVLQENCRRENDHVVIHDVGCSKTNIRHTGCHIKAQSTVINAGTRLKPQHIGLAASIGRATLPVFKRLKIALISTGDELTEPGQPLHTGKIYDANHYTLFSLLNTLGCEIDDFGSIADDPNETHNTLKLAATNNDIVITSGGVSVGDKDYLKQVISELGQLALWRLRIKPGKPFAFGKIGKASIIGLPGNPVSSFVTFCLLARPFILRTQGVANVVPKSIAVIADFERKKATGRREFMRVTTHTKEDSQTYAKPCASQDSATLISTAEADGLLCIPENQIIEKGMRLQFYPMNELTD